MCFPWNIVVWTLLWVLGRVWVYFTFLCSGSVESSPLCSHSRCSSLWGWPAPAKPLGSGQSPGGKAAVPFFHPQLRGHRALPANAVSDSNMLDSSGPGPKAVGYLVHVEHPSHHHLPWALLGLCPGSTWGPRGGNHPAVPLNSA